MRPTAYEAIVENGQIVLTEAVRLPEKARVYVLMTEALETSAIQMRSPRLARPELMVDFTKEVTLEPEDAGLR